MAKIKLKGISTVLGTEVIDARELAIANNKLYYGSAAAGIDGIGLTPIQVAAVSVLNNFTGQNKFKMGVDNYFQILSSLDAKETYALTDGFLYGAQSVSEIDSASGDILVNRSYVDQMLSAAEAMIFKGTIAQTNIDQITITWANGDTPTIHDPYTGWNNYEAGWVFKATGSIDSDIFGSVTQAGDSIMCTIDYSVAYDSADFYVTQANVEYSVIGANIVKIASGSTAGFIRYNADETVSRRTVTEVKTDLSLSNVENTALST